MNKEIKEKLFKCQDCGKRMNKAVTRGWKDWCFECDGKRNKKILKEYQEYYQKEYRKWQKEQREKDKMLLTS